MGPGLISLDEAARLLAAETAEVLHLMADGVLTQYRRGRGVLVDRSEIKVIGES